MRKGLISKIFIILLVVGLLFSVVPTMQAQATLVTVDSEVTLREALATPEITEILLGKSFDLINTVYINRSVIIDGQDNAINGPSTDHGLVVTADDVTINNLAIVNSGKSNLQFYRVTNGVLNNVVLDGAGNAGLIVNGSKVTISNVTTKRNAWGGINVDQGEGVTEVPLLTVSNVTSHTSQPIPTEGITPAIWVDTGNAAWVSVPVGYAIVPGTPLLFFDKAEFAASSLPKTLPVHNVTQNSYFTEIQPAVTAANTGDVIELAAGTYQEEITVTGKSFDLIGKTDGEGVPIVVLKGWLSISNSDVYKRIGIKGIYFEGTNSHLLKLSNVEGGVDIDNCVFDGKSRFMTDPHINGINLNTTIEVYVKNSVFKDGLYVGINGYNADWTEVYYSEFINIKSGINLQSNSHSAQIDDNYFKTKPVSDTDSYGVRFGSETGNANGLWMRRNTIEVDRTGGYTPSAGNYHAAIIIRAGVDPDAGPGNIYFTDNVINDELVTFYKVEYLDTYFAANTWPEGYGVLGNKITLIKPPQTIYLPLIFK